MNNELIPEKNWFTRNWKWLVPTFLFLILCGAISTFISIENTTDVIQAYSDNSLYEKAIEKAKTNERVIEVIGEIEQIDKLAILEGTAIYSNNNNSIETSIRIKGTKGKGKMDIVADKKGTEWIYNKINIRIKNPKEEIQILNDSIDVNKFDAAQKSNNYKPIENPILITQNFQSFWSYWNQYVKLSADFVALDADSKEITKAVFLKLLSSGKYLPLRLSSPKPVYYKLYKIDNLKNKDISSTIIQMANAASENFNREGKPFDNFQFTDLNGNIYTTENTKGKIIVFKFWYIHCQQCVAEIPSLNELVKKYKNRKDIIFISLAFDTNQELKKFLLKKTFNYIIVGNQKEYLMDELKISIYPTHMIVNKEGKVTKVVNSYDELEIALQKEVSK